MGELVALIPKAKRLPRVRPDDDINDIIKDAKEISKEKFSRKEDNVFLMYGTFENLLRAKIGGMLLTDREINLDLFRCSLYVSEMLGGFLTEPPESYAAIDYVIRGQVECEPEYFKKGGDLCFLLCTFFEKRCSRRRRPLRLEDYMNRGAQLYFNYHAETKNEIGYCMGENFRAIVSLTKRSIRTL